MVYGIIGLTSGIFGIVAVKTSLLSCFQTHVVLSLSLSVYLALNLFCLWIFSFGECLIVTQYEVKVQPLNINF